MALQDTVVIPTSRWDLKTQTPHGGQEWRDIPNFIQDFSVTTNGLGTPERPLKACMKASQFVHHYPPSDHDPAWSALARFLAGDVEFLLNSHEKDSPEFQDIKRRLLLGNGASELIDLCIRLCPGKSWKPGPFQTQYKEYQRSASNYQKILVRQDNEADLVCVVNPCNPTGDFLTIDEMKGLVEKQPDGSTIIVDESMILWHGPQWRLQSLSSQGTWIKDIFEKRKVSVYVIHSWTKIWACPGLRLGSILAPTAAAAANLRKNQVPWSLNCFATEFLKEVVHEVDYMERTWKETPNWRAEMKNAIGSIFPSWTFHGVPWQSFLWIDTHSSMTAEKCVQECKCSGVPIRWGKDGYECPTFIRIAVRHGEAVSVLLSTLHRVKGALTDSPMETDI